MRLSTLLASLSLTLTTSCGSAPPPPPLRAATVEWNGAHAAVGAVTAVAELDDTTVFFADDAATVVVAGAVTNVDKSAHRWVDAAVIPALDGNGRWIVGVDGDGGVWRLRARRAFEPISDRLGLQGVAVRGICAAGSRVAVLLDHEVAFAEAGVSTRIAAQGTSLACGANQIAIGSDREIRLFSSRGSDRTIALPTTRVAFLASDRLLALVRGHLYAMDTSGTMRSVTPVDTPISTIAASGDGAWVAWPGALGWFDGATLTRLSDPRVTSDTRLFASTSGDAWLAAPSALSRYRRGAAEAPDPWQASIAPIVQRTCRSCHGPDGSAGVQLVTEADWSANAAEIRDRVLVRKDMPPKGGLTEAERAAIARFVAH